MEFKTYNFKLVQGCYIKMFGWIVRCERYHRIPFEIRADLINYIRIGDYFIYAFKIWRWKKLITTRRQYYGLRTIWKAILNQRG